MSVVASTVYVRVQGDVRSLLWRDKLGNHYINIVAFLAAYTTILLGLMALGHEPAVLSLLLAVVIGVASVFSFVVLGYRSFHFFDPTNLVAYLIRRDLIIDTLNVGLTRAGALIGFDGRLVIEGLPTTSEVDTAFRRLEEGDQSFDEVMKPFIYY